MASRHLRIAITSSRHRTTSPTFFPYATNFPSSYEKFASCPPRLVCRARSEHRDVWVCCVEWHLGHSGLRVSAVGIESSLVLMSQQATIDLSSYEKFASCPPRLVCRARSDHRGVWVCCVEWHLDTSGLQLPPADIEPPLLLFSPTRRTSHPPMKNLHRARRAWFAAHGQNIAASGFAVLNGI